MSLLFRNSYMKVVIQVERGDFMIPERVYGSIKIPNMKEEIQFLPSGLKLRLTIPKRE